MGRKRLFKEVTSKEFRKELVEHYQCSPTVKVDVSEVQWKYLYATKIARQIEIPNDLIRKTKIRHGVYDLTKL